ncbi:hypothetical protein BN2475_820003 [Paraburkholderia ribeironis]|uniref:Uncharacterized protein n=1 Tax=Paraburkholderia ribeironis TaxID=1247936 RepID=A0A1N7SKF2_9BURK|nr:hypothetical protein BN2475_820003 [Paraburkholderia ribeironis]
MTEICGFVAVRIEGSVLQAIMKVLAEPSELILEGSDVMDDSR